MAAPPTVRYQTTMRVEMRGPSKWRTCFADNWPDAYPSTREGGSEEKLILQAWFPSNDLPGRACLNSKWALGPETGREFKAAKMPATA